MFKCDYLELEGFTGQAAGNADQPKLLCYRALRLHSRLHVLLVHSRRCEQHMQLVQAEKEVQTPFVRNWQVWRL